MYKSVRQTVWLQRGERFDVSTRCYSEFTGSHSLPSSAEIVEELTEGSGIEPGCVQLNRQESGALEFADGTPAARATMRVFGETREADSIA